MFIQWTHNNKESVINTAQITRLEIQGGEFVANSATYSVIAFFSDGKHLILGNFISKEDASVFLKDFYQKYLKKK